jgi:hypothetical protein
MDFLSVYTEIKTAETEKSLSLPADPEILTL